MQWTFVLDPISDSTHHYRIIDGNGRAITFRDVIRLWTSDDQAGIQFRTFLTKTLCDSIFAAFKWEMPVVDRARMDREFEFVVLDSPGLDRHENETQFATKFAEASTGESTIIFGNHGRDAQLVVPTPSHRDGVNHCHLAAFLRSADSAQTDDLWRKVGQAMEARVSTKPVWLSTAGGGVAWLHVRLDDRPKYYGYAPFRAG